MKNGVLQTIVAGALESKYVGEFKNNMFDGKNGKLFIQGKF